jgi:2'-5' RNA ligase
MTIVDDILARKGTKSISHSEGTPTTAVLVAVPSAMDPIRLVGDEEKHATLLFFGETSSLPSGAKEELLGTLEQVSMMTGSFVERILDISRLGTDEPPALVAMLTNRQLGSIREILQVNPKIKGYLSNTPQFPDYTPHVTLAYPDYQGEAAIRKTIPQVRRIQFDRLALWWNGERIEFNLNQYMDEPMAEAAWSEELVEKFLAHYGVPGMRWGVRKQSTGAQSGPTSVVVTQKKPGSKLKTSGGKGHPAHTDATTAASARQKAKSSRTDALSNDELQTAIKRMQLEQQFSQLSAGKQSAGKRFVKKLIGDTAGEQARSVVNTQAAYKIDQELSKRGRPVAAKSKYKFKDD